MKYAQDRLGDRLLAVVFAGSRIYGAWQSDSDLDVRLIVRDDPVERHYVPANRRNGSIALDIGVDPIDRALIWAGKRHAYADMLAKGRIVFPDDPSVEVRNLVERARTCLREPPKFRNSHDHHARFVHIARVLERATNSSLADQRLALGYAISHVVVLRLTLAGAYQFANHALLEQLESIDPGFAARCRELALERDPQTALGIARQALDLLRPDSERAMSDADVT